MLGAILGFCAPWAGEVLGILKGEIQGRREMKLLQLQLEHQASAEAMASERAFDIAELRAGILSQASARKDRTPWGVQLLDAADGRSHVVGKRTMRLAFLAFTLLDWLIGTVRPMIAYIVFAMWVTVELATVWLAYSAATDPGTVSPAVSSALEGLFGPIQAGTQEYVATTKWHAALKAVQDAWGPDEMNVMLTIIAFYFGERTRRRWRAKQ